jgi:hypothetical protein
LQQYNSMTNVSRQYIISTKVMLSKYNNYDARIPINIVFAPQCKNDNYIAQTTNFKPFAGHFSSCGTKNDLQKK